MTAPQVRHTNWGFEPWISRIRVHSLIHSAMHLIKYVIPILGIRTLDLSNKSPWSHPLSHDSSSSASYQLGIRTVDISNKSPWSHPRIHDTSSVSYQYWRFEPWISRIRVHGLNHAAMTAPQVCHTNIGDSNHGYLE